MTLKAITANNIKTRRTSLNQLVDLIQEDISGSATRRKYQVFVTGGIGPGVTSSLYQTVYDQDFTLQTANQLFDLTVGLNPTGGTVTTVKTGEAPNTGKPLFPSSSLMMREKIDIYKQHASFLLGDANAKFKAPFTSEDNTDVIDEALFINFKRLFTRDGLKQRTFAAKIFTSASNVVNNSAPNINVTSEDGSVIFIDAPEGANDQFGAPVGSVKDSTDANRTAVGVIFYDKGSVVLDMAKVFSGSQRMSGTIPGMSSGETHDHGLGGGTTTINSGFTDFGGPSHPGSTQAKFIPGFLSSGSIDTIIDHIATTRFSSGTLTGITFQNRTDINSTLIFCQATADEFNYSTNPTFTDNAGKLVVIDQGQEDVQRSFTFPTTVGLHDAFGNTLAVAKFSRPIEKNDEKDITFRIRLDF